MYYWSCLSNPSSIAVNFTQVQYTFNEGQNGSICVKGLGIWDESFKVDIQVVNDTAIGMDTLSHMIYILQTLPKQLCLGVIMLFV